MKSLRHHASLAALLVLFSSLLACRVSDDTVATAQQVAATAAGLEVFYAALAKAVSDTISLYEIDSFIAGIPFSAKDRQLAEDTRIALLKRKDMAGSLGKLATTLSSLTDTKTSAAMENAATGLGNALVEVKALPQGSPVPAALGTASSALLQLIRKQKLKQSDQVIDRTLAAVAELFESEQPVYNSLIRTRFREGAQIAKDLTTSNSVDARALLEPALKPYDLQLLPPNPQMQEALRNLALMRVQGKTEEALRTEAEASSAMFASLREINSRVHILADGHRMTLRENPPALKVVETWAASLN